MLQLCIQYWTQKIPIYFIISLREWNSSILCTYTIFFSGLVMNTCVNFNLIFFKYRYIFEIIIDNKSHRSYRLPCSHSRKLSSPPILEFTYNAQGRRGQSCSIQTLGLSSSWFSQSLMFPRFAVLPHGYGKSGIDFLNLNARQSGHEILPSHPANSFTLALGFLQRIFTPDRFKGFYFSHMLSLFIASQKYISHMSIELFQRHV